MHVVFLKHLLPGNAAQLQEGALTAWTAAAERRCDRAGGAGGCGKEAPGTVPGSVRAQLLWLGRLQLSSEGNGTE